MRRALVSLMVLALVALAGVTLEAQVRNTVVVLDRAVVLEGDNVSGTVTNVLVGEPVTVGWTDPFGDVIFRNPYTGGADGTIGFSFRAVNPFTPLGSVDAVSAGARGSGVFTVLPKVDTFWQGFALISDKAPQASEANAVAARRLGLTGSIATAYQGALAAGSVGLRPLADGLVSPGTLSMTKEQFQALSDAYAKSGAEANLVRTPSLSDPAGIQRLSTELSRQVERIRTAAPAGYIVAENPSTGFGNAPFDVSFAPGDLDAFRTYVANRMPGLLPRAEGAAATRRVAAFKPVAARDLRAQIAKTPDAPLNLALWALHREFMDGQLAAVMQKLSADAKTAARAAGEGNINWSMYGARTGVSGVLAPSAYGGYDWTLLPVTADFAIMSEEAPQWSWQLARDVMPASGALARVDGKAPGAPAALWRAAADGLAGVVVTGGDGMITAAAPPAPAPRARIRAGGVPQAPPAGAAAPAAKAGAAPQPASPTEGLNGPGPYMAASGNRAGAIALVYSARSVRAGWFMGYLATEGTASAPADAGTQALAAWAQILGDMGLDYHWVTMDEVAAGVLVDGRYLAAVMPEAWCVPQNVVPALDTFITGGGIVIADNAVGAMDGDYVAYRVSPLNAVFGIRRTPLTGATAAALSPGSPRAQSLGEVADANLAPTPETTAVTNQAGSTMIARKTQTGGSLYLNRFVEGYLSAPEETRAALRGELTRFLASGGITPKLVVYEDKTVVPAKENAYMFGRTEVFFIDLGAAPAAGARRTVEVRFRDAGNYYNLRSAARAGEFLGSGSSMEVAVPPSGPIVIARTPIVLTALTVNVDYGDGTIYITAQPQSQTPLGNRVLMVEFYEPSGARVPQFDRTVTAEGGAYLGQLALPLNSPAGTWTVLVRDVETGMASWSDVSVQ